MALALGTRFSVQIASPTSEEVGHPTRRRRRVAHGFAVGETVIPYPNDIRLQLGLLGADHRLPHLQRRRLYYDRIQRWPSGGINSLVAGSGGPGMVGEAWSSGFSVMVVPELTPERPPLYCPTVSRAVCRKGAEPLCRPALGAHPTDSTPHADLAQSRFGYCPLLRVLGGEWSVGAHH